MRFARACRLRVAGRNGVHHVAIHDHGGAIAGHVHHRRLAQYRDGFVQVADLERDVHRRGEVALQDDAGAPDWLEAGDRERDVVGAWAEIDDAVLAGAVGDGAAHAFDQRGAGGFHGHAGKRGARRVFHDTGNGGLGMHIRRQEQQRGEHDDDARQKATHRLTPPAATTAIANVQVGNDEVADVTFRSLRAQGDLRWGIKGQSPLGRLPPGGLHGSPHSGLDQLLPHVDVQCRNRSLGTVGGRSDSRHGQGRARRRTSGRRHRRTQRRDGRDPRADVRSHRTLPGVGARARGVRGDGRADRLPLDRASRDSFDGRANGRRRQRARARRRLRNDRSARRRGVGEPGDRRGQRPCGRTGDSRSAAERPVVSAAGAHAARSAGGARGRQRRGRRPHAEDFDQRREAGDEQFSARWH